MSKSKSASPTSPSAPELAYIYAGDGLGVPGLPHQVTRSQASELGLLDLLETAIAAGTYLPAEE